MRPKLRFKEFTDDWEEKKLGDFMIFANGINTDKSNYGIGRKMISVLDVLNDSKLLSKNIINSVSVSQEIEKRYRVTYGDVLFVRSSEVISEVGLCKGYIDKDNYSLYSGFIIRGKQSIYHPIILQNIINTTTRREIEKQAGGSTRYNISQSILKNIKIHLPSLPEQEKIGTFLSLVDQRIEKAEKKVSLLKEEKKGWMQKLFQQEIRFKDEQGDDYPDWEECTIQEIYKITRGKVLAKNKVLEEGKYPVYSSQTLNHGLLGYYDEYLFEDAITWTTDGANAGTVNFRKGKFYCTNVCGVLLNENGYSNKCMAEMLNSVAYRYVSKVGNPKLMNNVMAEISLQFPSLPEQEKIADFLSLLDQRIEKEERKVELLKEQKKGLLQNMFI